MKAVIYARCSTDERKQDVEVQLKELRTYCERQGWTYEEHSEYSSGSKHVPEVLRKILNMIKERHFDVFLVYDMSRFSRLHPTTTNKMIDFIVSNKCRFVSIQERMDSEDEMTWHTIRHIFQYQAWIYSKNLSEKVKLGMARAKEKGLHCGRPSGSADKKPRSKKGYYLKQREKLPF